MTHARTLLRLAVLALFATLAAAAPASAATFSNTGPITITADAGGGTPYPSEISVSGVSGVVTDVDVTLHSAFHEHFDDFDILLLTPTGRRIGLVSDVCEGEVNATLTFSHGASAAPQFVPCPNGSTYAPTEYSPVTDLEDGWPAGLAPDGSSLADVANEDPNGTWQLYVYDDREWPDDHGVVSGGWSLDIDVRDPAPVAFSVAALTVPEGGTAVVDVVRTGDSLHAGSVTAATSSGTAEAGSDFTPVGVRLDFAPGETRKRIEVPVTADGLGEGAQDFSIVLGSPAGDAAVGTPGAVGVTIPADPGGRLDDLPTGNQDPPPAKPFTRRNAFRRAPGARRCRRPGSTIRFVPRMPNGVAIVRSEVFVNRQKVEDNIEEAAIAPIVLKMQGRRMRVLIRLTSHDKRTLLLRRTFRRCKPKPS